MTVSGWQRTWVRILTTVLTIAMLLIIFFFSMENAENSDRRSGVFANIMICLFRPEYPHLSPEEQQKIYDEMTGDTPLYERIFQKSYIGYTKKQEKRTPQFQRLLQTLKKNYGGVDAMPYSLREEFRAESLKIIFWNGLLTFNFRSAWLFLFCLLDIPAMNFVWEIVVMGLLTMYVNRRHEKLCANITEKLA